jgi:hypothetical protein
MQRFNLLKMNSQWSKKVFRQQGHAILVALTLAHNNLSAL